MSQAAPAATTYLGRFAPSPTGPLHLGSLLAAVASYLDAKARNGRWLVRIEDVDILRAVPNADTAILKALEAHGLYWDGEIVYQSRRTDLYQQRLQQLAMQDLIYYCNCNRKMLRAVGGVYPGTCRNRRQANYQPALLGQPASHAIRFDTRQFGNEITWRDRLQGRQAFDIKDLGDCIIRRRDSLYAYQLAVVADDIDQQVNQVVRGVDLLDSTPWQLMLYHAFGIEPPLYAHLPLVCKADDSAKLSKQAGAAPVDLQRASRNLVQVLDWLGQDTQAITATDTVETILDYAVRSWSADRITSNKIYLKQQVNLS